MFMKYAYHNNILPFRLMSLNQINKEHFIVWEYISNNGHKTGDIYI